MQQKQHKPKVLTGQLKVLDTIGGILLSLWGTIIFGLIILSAFGYVHYKWAIMAVGAPLVAVGAILTGVLIVMLLLGFVGAIDTDWAELTKNEDDNMAAYPMEGLPREEDV